MTHYLVVAHQTASSPALIERARGLARHDRAARFTLLIPATHPVHLLARDGAMFTWDDAEAERRARMRAHEARMCFEGAGLRVDRALIGDAAPLLAIEDELRTSTGAGGMPYDAVVLSTLPPGASRWIAMDVHLDAERLPLPVIHVYEGVGAEAARSLLRQRPIVSRLTRWAGAPGRWLIERRQPPLRLVAALMLVYLVSTAALAFAADWRFFLNDLLALTVFAALLAALMRIEAPGAGATVGRDREMPAWMDGGVR